MSVLCTAKWSDGVVTKMSIYEVEPKELLKRAVLVSYAAYRSRTKYQGKATVIEECRLDNEAYFDHHELRKADYQFENVDVTEFTVEK